MADTGWLSGAATAEDTSDGSFSWSFGDYSPLLLEDATTSGNGGDPGTPAFAANLIIAGARVYEGASHFFSPVDNTLTFYTIGGAADKWSTTATQAQVVASNFGIAIRPTQADFYWAAVTDFSASVPAGATIDGFEARCKCAYEDYGGGVTDVFADIVQVKIYYTEAAGGGTMARTYYELGHSCT